MILCVMHGSTSYGLRGVEGERRTDGRRRRRYERERERERERESEREMSSSIEYIITKSESKFEI